LIDALTITASRNHLAIWPINVQDLFIWKENVAHIFAMSSLTLPKRSHECFAVGVFFQSI